jgi:AcrR family transcriptional regulator
VTGTSRREEWPRAGGSGHDLPVTAAPQDWRARKRDATHQRIYEAGMQLFADRGYDAVSVSEIAAAAKVSVLIFYAHYQSKEHVVLPIPDQADVDAVMASQPHDLPLAERVRSGMLAWLGQYGPEEREQLLRRWRIVVASPALRNRAAEFERATASLVSGALADDGNSSSVATDVVVTASLSAYTQILLRWAEADGRQSLEEVAESVLAALRQL